MKLGRVIRTLLVVAIFASAVGNALAAAFVRLNQAGYITNETKQAILMASGSEAGATFSVLTVGTASNIYSAAIGASKGSWSATYPQTYLLDFTSVTVTGKYTIQVTGPLAATSPAFQINSASALYSWLLSNAWFYFKAQRDGPNVFSNVLNRQPSHLTDTNATTYSPPGYNSSDVLTGSLQSVGGTIDVSGGWFDAGDYLKFLHTTCFVDGLMLFGVRQYPNSLTNASADFATEGKYGLDWLQKMWSGSTTTLYYQVGIGDGNKNGSIAGDHDFWRLPEADDQLNVAPGASNYYIKYRPVFRADVPGAKISPNLAGRLSAALALGFQVYRSSNPGYANQCLLTAQTIFDLAKTNGIITLLTASPHDYYPESEWRDDMEWGAAELYFATALGNLPAGLTHTNAQFYLQQAAHWAKDYLQSPNHLTDSFNLYDVSALAHYELHRAITQAGNTNGLEITQADLLNDLRAQLQQGFNVSTNDPFGLALAYSPSADPSPHAFGYAATANFYRELAGTNTFDNFARTERNWALGNNAWGMSFVIGAGTTYPHCPQHQVANLAGHLDGTPPILLGGTVDGPASDFSGAGLPSGANTCGSTSDSFPGKGAGFRDDAIYWQCDEPANDYSVLPMLVFAQQIGPPPSVTPFDAWRTAHFTAAELLDPSISGPLADANHDGIANLLEYAQNRDPKTAGNANGLPAGTLQHDAGAGNDYLTLTYTRVKAATDISYIAEATGNLLGNGWTSNGVLQTFQSIDNGATLTITGRDAIPISTSTSRFMRVHVTQP